MNSPEMPFQPQDLRVDPVAGLIYAVPGMDAEATVVIGAVTQAFGQARMYEARHRFPQRRPSEVDALLPEQTVSPLVSKGIINEDPSVALDKQSGHIKMNVAAARLGLISLEAGLADMRTVAELREDLDDGMTPNELIEMYAAQLAGDDVPRREIVSHVMGMIDRAKKSGTSEEIGEKIALLNRSSRLLAKAISTINAEEVS